MYLISSWLPSSLSSTSFSYYWSRWWLCDVSTWVGWISFPRTPFPVHFRVTGKVLGKSGRWKRSCSHFVAHTRCSWYANSPGWHGAAAGLQLPFLWILPHLVWLLSQVCVFSSVTEGPFRRPLNPRSEARIQVLSHSYGVPAHSCGHQPTSNFPFLIVCPVGSSSSIRCRDSSLTEIT